MASLPQTRRLTVEGALGAAEVARVLGVHRRTVQRRRAAHSAPRPIEAQREEKLKRVWERLLIMFTPEDAVYWLKHPVPALADRRPLDVMAEDGGLDRVLDTVGRMSWGLPT